MQLQRTFKHPVHPSSSYAQLGDLFQLPLNLGEAMEWSQASEVWMEVLLGLTLWKLLWNFHIHCLLAFPAWIQKVLVENSETLENGGVVYQNHYMESYLSKMELDFDRVKNKSFNDWVTEQ